MIRLSFDTAAAAAAAADTARALVLLFALVKYDDGVAIPQVRCHSVELVIIHTEMKLRKSFIFARLQRNSISKFILFLVNHTTSYK